MATDPCSADLQRQIEETEVAIKPLAARLETLRREKREVDSRNFIAANRIARADVEMSSGYGKPWFTTCYDFGWWMRTHHCSKLWAEWNGRIYRAADLMAGWMRETPGEADHLPNDQTEPSDLARGLKTPTNDAMTTDNREARALVGASPRRLPSAACSPRWEKPSSGRQHSTCGCWQCGFCEAVILRRALADVRSDRWQNDLTEPTPPGERSNNTANT